MSLPIFVVMSFLVVAAGRHAIHKQDYVVGFMVVWIVLLTAIAALVSLGVQPFAGDQKLVDSLASLCFFFFALLLAIHLMNGAINRKLDEAYELLREKVWVLWNGRNLSPPPSGS